MVEPHEAIRNLAALEREGVLGPYGFRDAVDFTRPEPNETKAVVGAYMAHHIGMTLVALANALDLERGQGIWQRRFLRDASVRYRYGPSLDRDDSLYGRVLHVALHDRFEAGQVHAVL